MGQKITVRQKALALNPITGKKKSQQLKVNVSVCDVEINVLFIFYILIEDINMILCKRSKVWDNYRTYFVKYLAVRLFSPNSLITAILCSVIRGQRESSTI